MTSPDSLDGLIARLRNYRWVTDFNPCPQAADAIERLRAERDAALVDARRYRWLRDKSGLSVDSAVYLATDYSSMDLRPSTVDATIDAALAAEPKDGAATSRSQPHD